MNKKIRPIAIFYHNFILLQRMMNGGEWDLQNGQM